MTTSAHAATTVVNWGGDYVSSTQEMGSEYDSAEWAGYGGFDVNGNPKLLAPTSGYTGGNFYGGILKIGGTSQSNSSSVAHASAGDLLVLKGDDANTAFLLLWETDNISFGVDSSVRLNVTKSVAADPLDSGRLVLERFDGSYYVSAQLFTGVGDTTVLGSALLNTAFYTYDPVSSIDVNNGSLSAASISAEELLSGITSVGFYFESIAAANNIQIQNFEVNATAVPEPSTYALLAGTFGLAMAATRRRR